ncbi:nuclear transport factor 2 family protein [Streptomyces sp. NPDC048521]|uniref:nuclear transport factor 2 family protein n=1 Tax=Streptomyces sp. NPDC048521 TaxID=3365566 RepID=UPI003721CAE4
MSTAQPAGRSPREVLERYHRAMLALSADDLADLYDVDAVHELPFRFPGMPERHLGREAVRAGYRAAWERSPARPAALRDVTVHDTADPEVVIAEQTVVGAVTGSGAPFAFPSVLVIRVRDGLITHVRDYMDGLGVARSLGRLPALAAPLQDAPAASR